MKVKLIGNWSGKKFGDDINVSKNVAKYLKSVGLIDKSVVIETEKTEPIKKKATSKKRQKKDTPIQETAVQGSE